MSTTQISTHFVMLRHISGFRGAILSLLPLILLMAIVSTVLLTTLVLDTSTQLWLWVASLVLSFAGSCICYGWIYRCCRHTRVEMPGSPPVFAVTTPLLGAWSFPAKRLIGFQAYTSETAKQRKRDFFILLVLSFFTLCATFLLFDASFLILVILFILVVYPILRINTPTYFHSGIILVFAKTDDFGSLVYAPVSVHICADDTTIRHLASLAEPIVEQNSRSGTN